MSIKMEKKIPDNCSECPFMWLDVRYDLEDSDFVTREFKCSRTGFIVVPMLKPENCPFHIGVISE